MSLPFAILPTASVTAPYSTCIVEHLGAEYLFLEFTVSKLDAVLMIYLIVSTASYDYGSSIMENRFLSPKWSELKKQGLFLRSSPEFRKTNWIGNSSTGVVRVSNPDAFVVLLTNPDTGANFYIARQTDSTST